MGFLYEHKYQTIGGTKDQLVTGDGTLIPTADVVASVPPGTHTHVEADITDLQNYVVTDSDATLNSLQFNGGTGSQGLVSWNTDEETLDLIQNGATLQIGQEVHYHVRNNTGVDIPDGTVVYATGTLGASGRITVAPFIANGTIPDRFLLGVTTETIENDTDGKVTHFGKVRGIDTSSFVDGDVLYPSPTVAGVFVTTEPVYPNQSFPIAFVIHAASNGIMFVRTTARDHNAHAPFVHTHAEVDATLLTAETATVGVGGLTVLGDETITGNLLVGTATSGASKLVVNDSSIQINTAKTPASATDTGTTGQIAWDSNYVYVCVATNTWKRAALASW